jgi:hypothetical protein
MSQGPFSILAEYMLQGGYSPVPLVPGTKRPMGDEWNRLKVKAMAAEEIRSLWRLEPRLGLGVAGGFNGLVPVDIDTEDGDVVSAILSAIPTPTVVKRGRKGFTAFYHSDGPMEAFKRKRKRSTSGFEMMVEILTTGQTVLPPTIHPETKAPFQWLTKKTLFNTRVGDLPLWSPQNSVALSEALKIWAPKEDAILVSRPVTSMSGSRIENLARGGLRKLAEDLASLSKGSRNQALFRAGCLIGRYVHHGVLSISEVEGALFAACQSNGLWADKTSGGSSGCRATLASAINRSRHDELVEPGAGAKRVSNPERRFGRAPNR